MASDHILDQLADYYEQEARKDYDRSIALWPDDARMLEMFAQDYSDHIFVAHCVRSGHLDLARESLWRMDTAAREDCPDRVYEFLYPDW